ncbi:MAG: hypothetical protein GPOALKHO_000410 [Sodalis sp.]|nr:MAG: hypothetical protein GPOALKHO_000410 [Sodalis sp.]
MQATYQLQQKNEPLCLDLPLIAFALLWMRILIRSVGDEPYPNMSRSTRACNASITQGGGENRCRPPRVDNVPSGGLLPFIAIAVTPVDTFIEIVC